jgi:hypothetical protein
VTPRFSSAATSVQGIFAIFISRTSAAYVLDGYSSLVQMTSVLYRELLE